MWLLIECDDPVMGPGHDEKRRIIIQGKTPVMIDIPSHGIEVHPCTPGNDGYHCQVCYKDIKIKKKKKLPSDYTGCGTYEP